MTASVSEGSEARMACEALCASYAVHADQANADALADLYISDGVFDRLGQCFVGRDAIRNVIASRPEDVWTRHVFSNIRIEIDADGCGAGGHADLAMERGRRGTDELEQIQAHFIDRYTLTDQGWRFASRTVIPAL